jgi:hypothetical protein
MLLGQRGQQQMADLFVAKEFVQAVEFVQV